MGFSPAQGSGGGGGAGTLAQTLALGADANSVPITGLRTLTYAAGTGSLLAADAGALQLGGSTVATDVAPGVARLQGQNAEAIATVNTQGGPIYLSGGIGSRSFTVYDYTQLHNAKAKICVNSLGTTTLTESTNWNRGASNNAAAASLGAAISGSVVGPYVTVSVVANVIYLTPKAGTYCLAITNDENMHPGMSAQKLGGAPVILTDSNHTDAARLIFQSNGLHGAVTGPTTDVSLFQYGGQLGMCSNRTFANGGFGAFFIFSDDYATSTPFNNPGALGPWLAMYAGSVEGGASGRGAVITAGGSGQLIVQTNGAYPLIFGTGGTDRWEVDPNGHLLAATDNTYDIGASGATRPRSVYAGTSLNVGGVKWTSGTGSPEGAVTAAAGSIYSQTDGAASHVLWVKESGSGNTGWVNK